VTHARRKTLQSVTSTAAICTDTELGFAALRLRGTPKRWSSFGILNCAFRIVMPEKLVDCDRDRSATTFSDRFRKAGG
jgi:hypothetical protein